MPTYDYECLSCGHKFELFQKISDSPAEKCPQCEGKIRRLIGSGCGLIFKGSGFYVTDYKRKNSNQSQKNNKGSEKKQENKDYSCPNQSCNSTSSQEE